MANVVCVQVLDAAYQLAEVVRRLVGNQTALQEECESDEGVEAVERVDGERLTSKMTP